MRKYSHHSCVFFRVEDYLKPKALTPMSQFGPGWLVQPIHGLSGRQPNDFNRARAVPSNRFGNAPEQESS